MSKKKLSDELNSVFAALPEIREEVEKDGWKKYSAGTTSGIDLDTRFDLYIRQQKLKNIEEISKISSITKSSQLTESLDNQASTKDRGLVSNFPLGSKDERYDTMTRETGGEYLDGMYTCYVDGCCDVSSIDGDVYRSLCVRRVGSYPSLSGIRSTMSGLVIAYEAKHLLGSDGSFIVLSWHFAVALSADRVIEFVFLRKSDSLLTLEIALGRIYDYLGIVDPVGVRKVRRYCSLSFNGKDFTEKKFDNRKDAEAASDIAYDDGKAVHVMLDWSNTEHIKTVLLCYAGAADISAFDQSGAYNKDILGRCTEVHNGVVMMQSEHIYPDSLDPKCGRNQNKYPLTIQVADVLCHTPNKKRSIKDICHAVGLDNMYIDTKNVRMSALLKNDPRLYFQHASCVCLSTLLYIAELYGYNAVPPVTLISAAAKVMRDEMAKTLRSQTVAEFDRAYRGIQLVTGGKMKKKDKPGFIQNSSMEPINDKARTVQIDFAGAFHGGYNMSSTIGYHPKWTTEYDLRSAYATAMCMVEDVDWDNPFDDLILNRELQLRDFKVQYAFAKTLNPLLPMFACVDFEFPADVKYPCIPVVVDGTPIYPLSSKGLSGVYATGPELYLALRLGAKVFVHRGYILAASIDPETGNSFCSLRDAVKQLVLDRSLASGDFGKDSIEAMTLKEMCAAGYGKVAQNVADNGLSEDGFKVSSPITNPVAASLITAIVRCEILAALNQISRAGYSCYAATTDGLISDMPKDELDTLDLFGFRKPMETARLFLTDGNDPALFDCKHQQDDLLNLSTRCYVSLRAEDEDGLPGVCAHGNLSVEYEKNSLEDRRDLYYKAISRTGNVTSVNTSYTSLRKLKKGESFKVGDQQKAVSLDFDMRRKPVHESFRKVMVPFDGALYEIANFDTVPFADVAEYKEYLKKKNNKKCLRTCEDWDAFWAAGEHSGTSNRTKDLKWAILFSCIAGHRAGFWEIAALDMLSGPERCIWVNQYAESERLFTESDWRNAGRKDRWKNILPYEVVKDKLREMQKGSDASTVEKAC